MGVAASITPVRIYMVSNAWTVASTRTKQHCTHTVRSSAHFVNIPVPQLPKDLDSTRVKAVLGRKPTLEAICARIRDGSIRRIVVLCGAGISVNAGIPDFRTKGTGLVTIRASKHNFALLSAHNITRL